MKTLKLDHELAQAVLAGTKTSTWRINDDKDLRVGDSVELIDKVSREPASWRAIGIAHIREVLEKHLGDLNADDLIEQGFKSDRAMYVDLRKYYGNETGPETAVKIIQFRFEPYPEQREMDDKDVSATTGVTDVKLYADGGSRGNPGHSASGYVIYDLNNNVIKKQGIYLGITTNNQAEYNALKLGLEDALRLGAKTVQVYMDSLLVINQMKGVFKIRNRDLWPINDAIQTTCQHFLKVTFTHVPRELNKAADAMVNEALDAHLKP